MTRTRWALVAVFVCALTLFYFANRTAYKAYFSDDDLDKMGWPTVLSNGDFVKQIVTPVYSKDLFRPIGYLYYRYMRRIFGLNYTPWVAVLQIGHIINVILLFFVLRRFDFSEIAAGMGALFWMFHGWQIFIYWQPQYIFEVLAAGLCLLSILLYIKGRWILALIPFWLAYKSKEIVVTLPAALLAWEWFVGQRKWKRLIPYFIISASFGLQALWMNRHTDASAGYALVFSPAILWHTIVFYASSIFFLHYAGFALLAVPFFVKDRRVWVGLAFTVLLFLPMLALPSRLDSVYWYIPMIGLAIAFAYLASRVPRWAMAVFFVLWFPLNYQMMKPKRSEMLAHADEARSYLAGLQKYAKTVPHLKAVVFQGTPPLMGSWGVTGAIHQAFGLEVETAWYKDPDVGHAMANVPMAVVGYYPVTRTVRGWLRMIDAPESYVSFSNEPPGLRLGQGWYRDESSFPWIAPKADIMLHRPETAKEFEILAYLPTESLNKDGPAHVAVFEEATPLGAQTISESKPTSLRWKLPDGRAGDHHITIVTNPVRHGGSNDDRDLAITVGAIGYVTPNTPAAQ